ncbi:peptide-binding protein [Bacillus carboniphilus]|uniref:Peptide-binding protein n=1 Tax=Bacillus carboniphilus TaxID=86663 RepID=A0ABY9JTV3_9BACI|nr:peptide-binding protein [Bacillus carboniphilus]WLR41865.1 peptide-binding protein [Bacillus carboniphilus]
MKRKSFLLGIALMLVFSLFLAACNSDDTSGESEDKPKEETNDEEKATAGEPVEGGEMTLAMFSAPKGVFNPILYEDLYDNYVLDFVFDPLWEVDDELNITIPKLAEKWEFSEDGKVLTINLRNDVKWHDGTAFTADDVIFTWETIAHKDYTASRYYTVEPIEGANEMKEGNADSLSGVEKVDDHTIKVTFTNPAANHLSNLWSTPMPKHLYKDTPVKDMQNSESTKSTIIGNSAYKISEIKPNEYVVLEKNEDYYLGKPYINKIIWKVLEQDVTIAALEKGDVDMTAQISPKEFEDLEAMDHITVKEDQDFGYQYMGFNLEKEKLQNKELRQAMVYAINREGIVDGLLKGHGTVLNQHIVSASWAYNEDLKDAYPYEPDTAKQILEDAGYKDTNGDGFVEDPDGNEVTFKLSYPSGNPVREQSAPAIQADLKEVGLNVELDQPAEVAAYYEAVEQGEYELFLAGWTLGVDPDPSGIWLSDDQWNFPRWKNEESDQLIKDSVYAEDAISDQNARKEYLKKWTELASEEAPYAFLYSQNMIEAWNNRIQGVEFNFEGAVLHRDHHKWWIPEDQQ